MKRWRIPRQEIIFIPSGEQGTHHELMLRVGRRCAWRVRFTHVELDDGTILLKDADTVIAWLKLIPDMDRVSGQTVYRRCVLMKDGQFWWPPEDVGNSLWDTVTAFIPRSDAHRSRTSFAG
jgi:hypothetical protein